MQLVASSSRTMRGAEIIRLQRVEAELSAMESQRDARAAEMAEQQRLVDAHVAKLRAARMEAFAAIKAANAALRGFKPLGMSAEAFMSRRNPDSMERIAARLCRAFGVPMNEVLGRRRRSEIVLCRHAIMYWCVRRTRKSLPQIARFLGGLDHTTVMHGKNVYPQKRARMGRTLREVR